MGASWKYRTNLGKDYSNWKKNLIISLLAIYTFRRSNAKEDRRYSGIDFKQKLAYFYLSISHSSYAALRRGINLIIKNFRYF